MSNKIDKILAEISAGELFDKITILEIKKTKISNKEKLIDINKELSSLNETVKKDFDKWKLSQCLIIHRFGKLNVNEPIVLIITQTKHRKNAFRANEYIIDFLKINAPFWKKEHTNKVSYWVEQNKKDLDLDI